MITIKENTTLVGVSELRTHLDEILAESKKHKVLIGKRNRPVAVLISMEKYHQMEETIEALEDYALGYLAQERQKRSKLSDYIDLKDAYKKIKV